MKNKLVIISCFMYFFLMIFISFGVRGGDLPDAMLRSLVSEWIMTISEHHNPNHTYYMDKERKELSQEGYRFIEEQQEETVVEKVRGCVVVAFEALEEDAIAAVKESILASLKKVSEEVLGVKVKKWEGDPSVDQLQVLTGFQTVLNGIQLKIIADADGAIESRKSYNARVEKK